MLRFKITYQIVFIPIFILLGTLQIFLLSTFAADKDLTAREIMQKVKYRDNGDNETAEMEMILIDKRGNKRIRKIQSFSKDMGKDIFKLMFFLHPADVKNTGFLTYDYDDFEKDDDQWIYLPALYKTKRIASRDKSGSFMGSDLTYADMTLQNLEDYEFKILKDDEIKGEKVWLIQSVPNKKAMNETGYTKSILFVRQDNFVVQRAVHWIKKGKKLKYYDVKKLELIDNIWVSTETHITTRKGDKTLHKTILRMHNVKFDQKINKNVFTVRRLEKGL